MKSLGRDVGIGGTGTTIYLVGLIIAIIGAFLLIILIGFSIVVLAGFLILIGGILIGAGFYKVGEIYNEGLVRIGGIFIAIPFSLFNFIGFIWAYIGLGFILAYIGLGKVKPLATATQQSFGPQVYQVGQGTIKNNGYAYITLYSSTPASIVSARIEGVNIMPISISPNVLQIGNNQVTMFFGNLQSLIPNRPYTITFTINIGGNIINISTTAIYQP